jgi:hypothetical protein
MKLLSREFMLAERKRGEREREGEGERERY